MGTILRLTCWEFIFKEDTDELNTSIVFFLFADKRQCWRNLVQRTHISEDPVWVRYLYIWSTLWSPKLKLPLSFNPLAFYINWNCPGNILTDLLLVINISFFIPFNSIPIFNYWHLKKYVSKFANFTSLHRAKNVLTIIPKPLWLTSTYAFRISHTLHMDNWNVAAKPEYWDPDPVVNNLESTIHTYYNSPARF